MVYYPGGHAAQTAFLALIATPPLRGAAFPGCEGLSSPFRRLCRQFNPSTRSHPRFGRLRRFPAGDAAQAAFLAFTLKFAPRGSGVAAGAHADTLFDAMERLGLKLEPGTVTTDVMVVDRVNRMPTPNSPDVATAFPPAPTEFEVAVIKASAPGVRTLDGYMAGGNTRVRYRHVRENAKSFSTFRPPLT